MLRILVLGCTFSMLTIAIHAVGTSVGISTLRGLQSTKKEAPMSLLRLVGILCCTGVYLLLLTIGEVIVWAACYVYLPDTPEFKNFENAVYFSIVTFSSLGYGDLVIASRFRLLAGIEAMSGLLIFGWSTALFATVFQRLWAEYDNTTNE